MEVDMETVGYVNTELWAVVQGATDSLLNLEIPYGYILRRIKLIDTPLHGELVQQNGMLDVKYTASNLSKGDHEFIFLCKTVREEIPLEYFSLGEMANGNKKADEFYEKTISRCNKEIFYILSMLRLCQEGNIEVADKLYIMEASYSCNHINRRKMLHRDNPISVYENLYEWDCASTNYFRVISVLPYEFIVLFEDIMERFGRGYSSSRYDDAYKNLVTLAEKILIGHNSEDRSKAKKEKFSNRLAAATAADSKVQEMHDKAMEMYKERSNETHEGNNLNITKTELEILRCSVRKLVRDLIDFGKNHYDDIDDRTFRGIKREYIKYLLNRIELLRESGFLN